MDQIKLQNYIRNIPDFPKKGINFKDITPLLADPKAFEYVIKIFAEFAKKNQVNAILAPEARGFIFGAALASQLKVKFVPARKPNKLPYQVYEDEYQLEYGTNTLQIHQDALTAQDRVLIIDDLIASAGTVHACINLVNKSHAQVVGIACLIRLIAFASQQKWTNIPVLSIMDL